MANDLQCQGGQSKGISQPKVHSLDWDADARFENEKMLGAHCSTDRFLFLVLACSSDPVVCP